MEPNLPVVGTSEIQTVTLYRYDTHLAIPCSVVPLSYFIISDSAAGHTDHSVALALYGTRGYRDRASSNNVHMLYSHVFICVPGQYSPNKGWLPLKVYLYKVFFLPRNLRIAITRLMYREKKMVQRIYRRSLILNSEKHDRDSSCENKGYVRVCRERALLLKVALY